MGVIALTQAEFDALYNFDLTNNKRLDQVRDVFCFSCATGLRYSDIAQLRQGHIQDGTITTVAMIFFDRRTRYLFVLLARTVKMIKLIVQQFK